MKLDKKQNRKIKFVFGILSMVLIIANVAGCTTKVPAQEAKPPIEREQAEVRAHTSDSSSNPSKSSLPQSDNFTPTEDPYPIPDDGQYHPSVKRPAGIVVNDVKFQEAKDSGMRTVSVEVVARSKGGEDYFLMSDRGDKIVSITGASGKIYDMSDARNNVVTLNMRYGNFTEVRILAFQEIDVSEKSIASVILSYDGKMITLDAGGENYTEKK